jgi:hypothetical protein
MKICFLTQTSTDVSDYYKSFFAEKDLFFITFKHENDKAIGFHPKSSWSFGRNELWQAVKNKYDYYVFIDDDLKFYNINQKVSFSPLLSYAYYKFITKSFIGSYEMSSADYFFSRLEYYLVKFKPEILSVTQLDGNIVNSLDTMAMRKNSFVRRTGFFDAQFTVMSNYAANKLLPYDTKLSGWSSSQIPVYLYAFNVFSSKSINVSEIGVANSFHIGVYVENYDGMLDCERMIRAISDSTSKDYSSLSGLDEKSAVDYLYGRDKIVSSIPKPDDKEDYKNNFERSLRGIENLLHDNMSYDN